MGATLKLDVPAKPVKDEGGEPSPLPSTRLTAANLEHHRARTGAHADVGTEGAEFAEEMEGPNLFVRENWQVSVQSFLRAKLSEKNGRTSRMVHRMEQMRKE